MKNPNDFTPQDFYNFVASKDENRQYEWVISPIIEFFEKQYNPYYISIGMQHIRIKMRWFSIPKEYNLNQNWQGIIFLRGLNETGNFIFGGLKKELETQFPGLVRRIV